MDMGEVLIITPCVGVDLCVRKREKREARERGGNNVPVPPPTAWICHKRLGKEGGRSREAGEMYRDSVKEEGEEECARVVVCVLLLVCLSATLACVALHLRTESASITGEAIQSLGRGCHPLPSSTKRVNFSSGSAP